MRPHEEEWMTFPGVANQHGQTAVTDNAHRMVCLTRAYDGDELARFIAAAPAMARALLAVADETASTSVDGLPCYCTSGHREDMRRAGVRAMTRGHQQWCNDARAALKKAGVIP
jgi:hypothetical protein